MAHSIVTPTAAAGFVTAYAVWLYGQFTSIVITPQGPTSKDNWLLITVSSAAGVLPVVTLSDLDGITPAKSSPTPKTVTFKARAPLDRAVGGNVFTVSFAVAATDPTVEVQEWTPQQIGAVARGMRTRPVSIGRCR